MEIVNCTIQDFEQIRNDISEFWGSDRTLHLHHPFLIYEFGDTSFAIKHGERIIAYMFAFFSQTESCGYVHLIGVRNQYQNQGLGKMLYEHLIKIALSRGVKRIKAITSVTNMNSIRFHTHKIGMSMLGSPNENGINVIKNYAGTNEDRVVFELKI